MEEDYQANDSVSREECLMEITAPHRSDESSAALNGFQCGHYSMEIQAKECWTSAFFYELDLFCSYYVRVTEKDEKLENWEVWVE